MTKLRVRVKAPTRILGRAVPVAARPGDLVVGNRGAAARVLAFQGQGPVLVLYLDYVGNIRENPGLARPGHHVWFT
jgi:hypothetical protein